MSATIIPRLDLQHFRDMEALELQFYAADFITPAEESWSWYDQRRWYRHRPPLHAHDRRQLHPRHHPLPAAQEPRLSLAFELLSETLANRPCQGAVFWYHNNVVSTQFRFFSQEKGSNSATAFGSAQEGLRMA